MDLKIKDEFDLNKAWGFIKILVFGSVSGMLMKFGSVLILSGVPGMCDMVLYGFDSYVLKKEVSHPGSELGYLQFAGFIFFIFGLVIKLNAYIKEHNKTLRKERLNLKENYHTYSDAALPDEFERLYFVVHPDLRAIKNLLGHPYNQNKVISLFTTGRNHVDIKDEWFIKKSKYLRLRANIAYTAWLCVFPGLVLLSLALSILELFFPGVTESGAYASILYVVMAILLFGGAKLMMDDISSLGHAISLVDNYKPEK